MNTGSELRNQMRRLTVVRDGDEYVVGRADLEIYVAVPEPGAMFIVSLRDGQNLANATALAASASGGKVEANEFLADLRAAGLLAGAGTPVTGIPRRLIRPLFGRIAWCVYGFAAAAVIAGLILRPELRPVFNDVWFLDSPIWSVLAIAAMAIVITAGRECWRWLAVRAMGVPARFRIGRRGIFIVFETDISRLATVPRRARYSPMLAGFAFDVAVMALALGVRFGFREGLLPYATEVDALLGAVAFRQVLVLVWQLAGAALRAGLSSRDRFAVNWFWLATFAGGLAMLGVLVTYLVPPALRTFALLATGTPDFWQSVAVVVMLLAQFTAFPLIDLREKRRRHTRQEPAPSSRTESDLPSPVEVL